MLNKTETLKTISPDLPQAVERLTVTLLQKMTPCQGKCARWAATHRPGAAGVILECAHLLGSSASHPFSDSVSPEPLHPLPLRWEACLWTAVFTNAQH